MNNKLAEAERAIGQSLHVLGRDCPKCEPQRFRFVKDDDGHDYLIPAELENQFNEWVAESDPWREPQDEEDVYDGPSFDEYRTDMSPNNYTFTDPKEDK